MEALTLKRNIQALQTLCPERIEKEPRQVQLDRLPVWIKSAVRLFELQLPSASEHIYLIYPKKPLAFEQLMRVHNTVSEKLGGIVLWVADHLPPKHRPLLVKFRISFVYKDESIFAPDLGVKFGNLKKLRPNPKLEIEEKKEEITPFALKLLAGLLLNQIPTEFSLKLLFGNFQKKKVKLSLSKLSMAVNELATSGFLLTHGAGPQKFFEKKSPQELWQQALATKFASFFRETQTNYIPKDRQSYCMAGETALAHYSNLAPPKQAIIAMTAGEFRRVYQELKKTIPYGDFGSSNTVQVWKEDPRLFSIDGVLNPIELFFSLRHHPDERIQMSLDEMLKPYGLRRKD